MRKCALDEQRERRATLLQDLDLRPRSSDSTAEAISERTKPALAAAKAHGAKLGTPDPVGAVARMGVALKARAAQFAGNVLPIIREIQRAGYSSHNAIASQLNACKVATTRGGRWTHVRCGRSSTAVPQA